MAARDEIDWDWEIDWFDLMARSVLYLVYAACAGAAAFILYVGWLEITSGNPEYTVTFAGVDGLDAAALKKRSDQAAAVSPVFDVALRIDNTLNKAGKQCIGKRSSAVVSYRDAVLGRGTVPEFCAPALGEGETTVTAWAMDVQMPRFLRNRLAGELERGEAVLDVAVRAPGSGSCSLQDCIEDGAVRTKGATCLVYRCMDLWLDCKAKIGGGASPPCLVTDVDPRLATPGDPRLATADSFKR